MGTYIIACAIISAVLVSCWTLVQPTYSVHTRFDSAAPMNYVASGRISHISASSDFVVTTSSHSYHAGEGG